MVNVGDRIYHFRKKRKMTQMELAANAGISQSLLSKIEADNINTGHRNLIRIAGALSVTLDVLLKEDQNIKEDKSRMIDNVGERKNPPVLANQ